MVYIDDFNAPFRRMTESQRFWSKVSIRSKNECWPWTAGTNGARGYGRFRRSNGPVIYAHRMAFELTNRIELSNTDVILHSCDNPRCCNPRHLSKGTQADNLKDMVGKGRHSCGKGSRHGSSKLAEKDVLFIRNSSKSNTELAKKFGVKQHTISNIRTRKTWRYI